MVDEADELNDTDPHEGRGNQVRSMGPRDIAQASVFADILAAEVATLRSQLRRAEKRWYQRRDRGRREVDPPARLARLRERLDEAVRLSEAAGTPEPVAARVAPPKSWRRRGFAPTIPGYRKAFMLGLHTVVVPASAAAVGAVLGVFVGRGENSGAAAVGH